MGELRCHHYLARTQEHARDKANKNNDAFIVKQLAGGVLNDDGWFNSVRDPAFVESSANSQPEVCVAFLSSRRLEKLQLTYEGVKRLIATEPQVKFAMVILDNGSSPSITTWIRRQRFDEAIFLDTSGGTAHAMERLWDACGTARFILSVEDDWVFNEAAPTGVLTESMRILGDHPRVLEVWLRP